MKKYISAHGAPKAIGPYSQAVLVNGFLYVSGQIPIHVETGDIVEDIEGATHQVMKNLKAILEEAGMSFENVIKTSIFLKNMRDFQTVNSVYASYLEEGCYPARETVEVSRLPKGVCIEISLIAYRE
ncbi:MAG: RidA family protein [Bergeyella sp.]|nr:RidA family protein [Bergeyella sp.]